MDTKNLATLSRSDFQAFLAAHKGTRGPSGDAPKVGDRYTLCADGRELTVVRVEPKAKTCCYFVDAAGNIFYRNFTDAKGQTKRVAAPAKPSKQ